MKKYYLLAIIIVAFLSRVVLLNKFPIGINADEAAIGYNAYSLIETGKDEHSLPWPLVFRSFDDYKPPLYVYLVLPFIKVLGLNAWSVRLPAALLGVGTVVIVYFVCSKLFSSNKTSLLAALITAISPWAIHFSRGGWEVNASTFFIALGVLGFLYRLYPLFVISLVASLYTYHSARLVSPLLGLIILLIYKNSINWRHMIANLVVGSIFTIPVLFQMVSGGGTSRFNGVSIFADPGPLAYVHEMRRVNPAPDSLFTKIKYNRYSAYTFQFIKNYFSHFSPQFLFINGDIIDRSRTPGVGQLFYITIPFLLLGIIITLKNLFKSSYLFVFCWLLLAPIAASLTYQSPHALRAQNMIVPLSIITGIGFTSFFKLLSSLKTNHLTITIGSLLFATLSLEFSHYLYQYFIVYPKVLPVAWQYGFKDLSDYLSIHQQKYHKIIVTTRYDQPYILLAFYLHYPPQQLQQQLVMSAPDNFGFSTGTSFANFEFRKIDYPHDKQLPNALLVIADEPIDDTKVFKTISYQNGLPTLKLIETDEIQSKLE